MHLGPKTASTRLVSCPFCVSENLIVLIYDDKLKHFRKIDCLATVPTSASSKLEYTQRSRERLSEFYRRNSKFSLNFGKFCYCSQCCRLLYSKRLAVYPPKILESADSVVARIAKIILNLISSYFNGCMRQSL